MKFDWYQNSRRLLIQTNVSTGWQVKQTEPIELKVTRVNRNIIVSTVGILESKDILLTYTAHFYIYQLQH